MSLRRLLAATLVLLVVLSVFAGGCISGSSATNGHETGKTSTSTVMQSTGYVEVKDMSGRVVKIKEPVNRIVSLYGIATQVIYLFGVKQGEKVVGSTPLALHDGFIQLLDPEAKKRMVLVRHNVETIEKLHPDVVFAAYWENPEIIKQIESLGIPVVVLNLESVENFTRSVEIIGKVLGEEDRAREIVSFYKNAVSLVTNRTRNIPSSERPKVLLLEYSMKDKAFKAPGREFFQNRLIEMAGGTSVSASLPGGWNVVDAEQVAKWNPDIIVVVSYWPEFPPTKAREELLSDPAWKAVKAVRDGKVYALPNDGESWDFGPKWVLGLYWMAKLFHPGLFKDLNVTAKADQFYREFYGIDPSKVTITGDMP